MALLDSFQTSVERTMACGHSYATAVCSCGLSYHHGGQEVGNECRPGGICTICTDQT